MYILDEPSIGLHSRDTQRLIKVLRQLRDLGNTVIIVEHDEEIIKAADQIIDIGPMAGIHGGELVFQGTFEEIIKEKNNLTGDYLSGKRKVIEKPIRRKWKDFIEVVGIDGVTQSIAQRRQQCHHVRRRGRGIFVCSICHIITLAGTCSPINALCTAKFRPVARVFQAVAGIQRPVAHPFHSVAGI